MQGYTLEELRTFLQSVRGETRVKTKEESIRNTFLQAACTEIYQEHDWEFTHRSATMTASVDPATEGWFEAPADFSMFNDWAIYATATKVYEKDDGRIRPYLDEGTGKVWFKGISGADTVTMDYFRLAPDITTDNTKKIYFPQPMLIAERAYVRLKTAYFPDESSDRELQNSKKALRSLWADQAPVQTFQPQYRRT